MEEHSCGMEEKIDEFSVHVKIKQTQRWGAFQMMKLLSRGKKYIVYVVVIDFVLE